MADDAAKAAERENILIQRVLQVCVTPTKDLVHLPGLASELGAKNAPLLLSLDLVDIALVERLTIDGSTAAHLAYLGGAFARCADSGLVPSILQEKALSIQGMVANYLVLAVQCPEMFGASSSASDAGVALTQVVEHKQISSILLVKLGERLAEEDMDLFKGVFTPLLTKLVISMAGRDMQDMKLPETGLFCGTMSLASRGSALASLVTELPIFHPKGGPVPGQVGLAFKLQSESLLGYLLGPSPIDNHVNPTRANYSVKAVHFAGLARKTPKSIQAIQVQLRGTLTSLQEDTSTVINTLVRSGEEPKRRVLEWFGAVMTGTEARTKMSNQIGHASQVIDMLEHGGLQSIDQRLMQMQGLQARMIGFATSGFAMNVFWTLLLLVKPVKIFSALDPFFLCRNDVAPLMGGFIKEERFLDKEAVEEATQSPQGKAAIGAATAFKHQIFWAALKGFHVLMHPTIKDAEVFLQCAGHYQREHKTPQMESFLGEWLCNETVLNCSSFLTLLGHLISLALSVVLGCAYPDLASKAKPNDPPGKVFEAMVVPPEKVSPEFLVLPACIVGDIIEVLEFYQRPIAPGQTAEIFSHIDPHLLVYSIIFILGSSDHFRNPSVRGNAAKLLKTLSKMSTYQHIITTHPCCISNIIPSCIRVFTAVEKTKQSYYDIRMHIKFELRIPIMELFEIALPLEDHREVLKRFAKEKPEDFLKFANQLMNDSTHLLDEGMDALLEVRGHGKQQSASSSTEAAEAPRGHIGATRGEEVEEDERNAQGEDIYRQSRHDPKEHCKRYMQMGHRTIRTLWNMAREVPSVLVSDSVVLTQMLQSCLNSVVDRLLGPKCLQLKNTTGVNDFDEFNFKPKDLLMYVVEMYVCIAKECEDKAIRIIVEDERNYSPKTFQKAARVGGREGIIQADTLKDFETFVAKLAEFAQKTKEAMANVEIPDEFLDPIMQEMMADPVRLPTSNNIMDRKNIQRIIMADDTDPFSRARLTMDMLEPQPELKARIHAFCKEHGLPLDED